MSARVYLIPGFFGFANLGELRYFAHVQEFLAKAFAARRLHAEIHVIETRPTSSLPRRAARVLETIAETSRRGDAIHLIGHSSGGLDARLAVAPDVSLPTRLDVARVVRNVRSVVTVSTPHHGTPIASFFTGLLGQQLLQLLSLATIYVLRFGHLPLSALLKLGGVFARLDAHVGVNSALLDELFGHLLADFSAERRQAIQAFFRDVGRDRALLLQLTPEGMDVFNASTRDRPGVRYGAVVTQAQVPGLRSTLAAGLDPAAQATHVLYHALYRLSSLTPRERLPPLTKGQTRVLRRVYGRLPGRQPNDGVVPTRSQPWGEILHVTRADHFDVVGHFGDAGHVPPHFDWLSTGSGFTRARFERLWWDVARYVAAA